MKETVKDANNIIEFLASEGYVRFSADSEAATKDLFDTYKRWCGDNAYNSMSSRSFSNYLAQHTDEYDLEASNNIYLGGGKRCRGYRGIEVLDLPYMQERNNF
jgi:putative DNA primase/helicase